MDVHEISYATTQHQIFSRFVTHGDLCHSARQRLLEKVRTGFSGQGVARQSGNGASRNGASDAKADQ
jgi:hypothetical protein